MDITRRDKLIKSKKKAQIRNRCNQVPHLTRDTIWESTQNITHNRVKRVKRVSPFPADDHNAASNGQDSITMTDVKYK